MDRIFFLWVLLVPRLDCGAMRPVAGLSIMIGREVFTRFRSLAVQLMHLALRPLSEVVSLVLGVEFWHLPFAHRFRRCLAVLCIEWVFPFVRLPFGLIITLHVFAVLVARALDPPLRRGIQVLFFWSVGS